ncbi:hypothetical protein GCM10009765_04700 [Fodinicola feengrottensis]|uniref:Uncharacterized protein n=1 Tax=Fodinicola feengrottensis TaxID=435914 RepID=A0ABN2FSM1_9ACTN
MHSGGRRLGRDTREQAAPEGGGGQRDRELLHGNLLIWRCIPPPKSDNHARCAVTFTNAPSGDESH